MVFLSILNVVISYCDLSRIRAVTVPCFVPDCVVIKRISGKYLKILIISSGLASDAKSISFGTI
ncbi:hypothetical protein DERP_002586 [Dermatophagoides pteronyssinus]|uniref:Uncharacterized protein n=1 Tax=Dermatophagoides pteronyssinus TaxID=6956 RepID=A0ABQ8JI64_DERPT|nr:hypothetical protein DERP_002586 [Dermatophagoides pteronyssinus]